MSKVLTRESDIAEKISKNGKNHSNAGVPTFTFRNGKIARLLPISPWKQQDLAELIAARTGDEPEPPLQEVKDLEGKLSLVPNPQAPEYRKLLQERGIESVNLVNEWYIAYGVDAEIIDEQELSRYLARLAKLGKPREFADDDEKLVFYVTRFCISHQNEYVKLLQAIRHMTEPTEEEIELAKNTFRS